MNYHTFELSYKLTPYENEFYTNILFSSKGRTYRDKDEYVPTIVCETLSEYGIIIKIQTFTKNDFNHYMLYYRINPRRVMEQNNYIGLFNAKDTDIMLDMVNEYLEKFHTAMPAADVCKMHRIDFCANIEMSDQKEIFEYIKILQRGYCPPKYFIETFYDLKAKRNKQPKNSCGFEKKKITKVVYYNKYDQLKDNKKCKNIEDARNILRAEIQCNTRKVRHLINKFGCTSVRGFLKHSNKIGTYIFEHYANVFCGSGNFHKIDEIYKKIDASKFKEKSKIKMHELVRLSAKHKSLQTAIDNLGWSHSVVKDILKKFDKIGTSPVVIPLRSKYDMFENPLTLALNS